MALRAADGQEHDVILLPALRQQVAGRGLHIAVGLAQLGGGGNLKVLFEPLVQLRLVRIPDLLFDPADGVVLKLNIGVFGSDPFHVRK